MIIEEIKLSDNVSISIEASGKPQNPGHLYTVWWQKNGILWRYKSPVSRKGLEGVRQSALRLANRVERGKVSLDRFTVA